jgi:hypothetical protein
MPFESKKEPWKHLTAKQNVELVKQVKSLFLDNCTFVGRFVQQHFCALFKKVVVLVPCKRAFLMIIHSANIHHSCCSDSCFSLFLANDLPQEQSTAILFLIPHLPDESIKATNQPTNQPTSQPSKEQGKTAATTNEQSRRFEPSANDNGASNNAQSWLIEPGQGDC